MRSQGNSRHRRDDRTPTHAQSRSRSPRTPRRHTRDIPEIPFTPFKTKHIDQRKPRERDLSPISYSIMRLAARYFRVRLATLDAYPSESEVVSWVKASFRQACADKNAPRRQERFNQDVVYYKYMFKLVRRLVQLQSFTILT